ncbi:hypothetical protein A9Q83_11335 [Alphaproteobacteria bacterium 46_93_T64]|nr:hypothetical protein A9Q83_11335 [Alphaproteobacteria bacterium 46_93_T64]
MKKLENGTNTAADVVQVVTPGPGDVISLPSSNITNFTFSQDGGSLLISDGNGYQVLVQDFLVFAGTDAAATIELQSGEVVPIEEIIGSIEGYDLSAVAPAAGGAGGGTGGGAEFSSYSDGGIGDGLGIDGLLEGTAFDSPLREQEETPETIAEEVILLGDPTTLIINEISLGSYYSYYEDMDDRSFSAQTDTPGQGYQEFSQATIIELRNNTNEETSTAGTNENGATTLLIKGPEGEIISINLPDVTIMPGGSLVIVNGEIYEGGSKADPTSTSYFLYDDDHEVIATGVIDEDAELWSVGDDTTEALAVAISWSNGGPSTIVDAFLANGGTLGDSIDQQGWSTDLERTLEVFGDSVTFNGQLASAMSVVPELFDAYSPISETELMPYTHSNTGPFSWKNVNGVFSRVDNHDSDTAADWTTNSDTSTGHNNWTEDHNPSDGYDRTSPQQPFGPVAAPDEDGDPNGQNILTRQNSDDFEQEDGSIDGGRGQDFLFGGLGEDTLQGGYHNDFLTGGADNDILRGDQGADVLIDNDGNDILIGGSGTDVIFGRREIEGETEGEPERETNEDEFEQTALPSVSAFDVPEDFSDLGDDYGFYQPGTGDLLVGDEMMTGGYGNDSSQGSNSNQFPRGDNNPNMADVIVAGDGSDLIFGDNAFSLIGNPVTQGVEDVQNFYYNYAMSVDPESSRNLIQWSDGGDDYIYGGHGDDAIFGQGGHDLILAGFGDDFVAGGTGDDHIRGNSGNDKLAGDIGNDTMDGGAGHDEMFGLEDDDVMYGGTGNDEMLGGDGEDVMYGGIGDDLMYGGAGNDLLNGGSGNDAMFGGSGNDILETEMPANGVGYFSGGQGFDTLVVNATDVQLADPDFVSMLGEIYEWLGLNSAGIAATEPTATLTRMEQDFQITVGNDIEQIKVLDSQGNEINLSNDPQPYFTGGVDEVDFNTIDPNDFIAGTHTNALGGNDTIYLPTMFGTAQAHGMYFGQAAPFGAGSGDDTIILSTYSFYIKDEDGDDTYNYSNFNPYNGPSLLWYGHEANASDTFTFQGTGVSGSLWINGGYFTSLTAADLGMNKTEFLTDNGASLVADGYSQLSIQLNKTGPKEGSDKSVDLTGIEASNHGGGFYTRTYGGLGNDTVYGSEMRDDFYQDMSTWSTSKDYFYGNGGDNQLQLSGLTGVDRIETIKNVDGSVSAFANGVERIVAYDVSSGTISMRYGQNAQTYYNIEGINSLTLYGANASDIHVADAATHIAFFSEKGRDIHVGSSPFINFRGLTTSDNVGDINSFDWSTASVVHFTNFDLNIDTVHISGLPDGTDTASFLASATIADEFGALRIFKDDVVLNFNGKTLAELSDIEFTFGDYIGGTQTGIDTLIGGDGDDIIFADDGADSLIGGDGDDTLIGGHGADTLYGQDGDDVFRTMSADDGDDIIMDFVEGEDVIDLDDLFDILEIAGPERAAKIQFDTSTSGAGNGAIADTVITIDGAPDFSITVVDVSLSDTDLDTDIIIDVS